MNPQTSKRNSYIDIVKAFCIISVILGHCIQYGSGYLYFHEKYYFDNYIFKFIYSFHMPLFMLISGYLFAYSTNHKSYYELLKSKLYTLLVPIFSWSTLIFLIQLTYAIFSSNNINMNIIRLAKDYVWLIIGNLWFLWAIFWCSLCVVFTKKLFKDSIFVYILIFILLFFVPDNFGFNLYKYMYPFFVCGYIYNQKQLYRYIEKFIENNKTFILSIFMFFFLLLFYNQNCYIYTSGHTLLYRETPIKQLIIDIYRYTIGFSGSIFILLLIKKIYPIFTESLKNNFQIIGMNTLGIYAISSCIFLYILPKTASSLHNINYFLTFCQTITILLISLIGAQILTKIKIFNILFLGGRK